MALRRRATDAPIDFFPGFADVVEIGTGSVSTVYRAREIATGRWFALKLFDVRAAADALPVFEHDSAVVRALADHPNIVTLYGSFRTGAVEGFDARPVQVLELCSTSVDALLKQAGAVPVRDAISLGVKIAGALESAHRAQLVHGDVKPQNLLVTASGQPALADFGLAALRPSAAVTAARAGAGMLHVAPELFEQGRATPAADVYSLAATLYHLVAGRPAFGASRASPPRSSRGSSRDPVLPLSAQQAPARLSELLLAAMSKDVRSRPPTAAVFAAELGAIEAEQRWPHTEFVVRAAVAPAPLPEPPGSDPPASDPLTSDRPGWTPPPAEDWFPPPAPPPTPPTSLPASTEWSEPIRSAPRHARPDDDEAAEVDNVDEADEGAASGAELESEPRDEDGLTPAQYAAFEAAAVHAPATTINPIMPGRSIEDSWSEVSLSESLSESPSESLSESPSEPLSESLSESPSESPSDPSAAPARPRPTPAPRSAPASDPFDETFDPGATTAHPLWRQEQAAAAGSAAAEPAPAPIGPADEPAVDATVQHALPPESIDPNLTVARYPIPPPVTDQGDQPAAGGAGLGLPRTGTARTAGGRDSAATSPSTRCRCAAGSPFGPARTPSSSTTHASSCGRGCTAASWCGPTSSVSNRASTASALRAVAVSWSPSPATVRSELPATKRSMADLRYVQALLNAYRHRAQLSVN